MVFAMKTPAIALLIGVIALTGCAHSYVLRLTNGSEITTASKPHFRDGAYWFKDAKGEEQWVMAASVSEIAPASVAKAKSKSQATKIKSDKKRKWYLLWLG
jgi:hypothetical protein